MSADAACARARDPGSPARTPSALPPGPWPATLAVFAVLLYAHAQAQAQAQITPAEAEPRTWVQLQFTAASVRSASRADGPLVNQPGTLVQHESELGLARHGAWPSASAGRRIGAHWRIEGEYSASRRSGSAVLARDVLVDGYAFSAGSTSHSSVEIATLRVNGGYSLLHADGMEWGLSFGGHGLHVARRVAGLARDSGNGNVLLPVQADARDVGLQALVGAYGTLALGPAWQLSGRADVGVGGGTYAHVSLAALWRATPHIQLGVGLRATRADVDIHTGFISGTSHLVLDYRIAGPQAFLRAGF